MVIDRRHGVELYLALNKGGVFKLFRDGHLVCSDTQFSAQVEEPTRIRTAVAHLIGNYEVEFGQDSVSVSGALGWAKGKQMTTFNLLVLRFLMLSVGRFFPDLIRKLLQKLLITGRKPAPLEFTRRITWEGGKVKVRDRVADAVMDENPRGGYRRVADLHLCRHEPHISGRPTATLARPYGEDSCPPGGGGVGSRTSFLEGAR